MSNQEDRAVARIQKDLNAFKRIINAMTGKAIVKYDLDVAGNTDFINHIPTLPSVDPTEDDEAVRKKYVDDALDERIVYGDSYWSNEYWDGDDTKTTASSPYDIDTSSAFSIPAGVKMVLISVQATWAAAASASYMGIRTTSGTLLYSLRAHTDYPQDGCFLVPCDSNGDFRVTVHNANATAVKLYIIAYWL